MLKFEEIMRYDPNSPSGLSWIETKYSGEHYNILVHKDGDFVGTLNTSKPYWRVTIKGRAYSCHRIICHIFKMFDYYDYGLQVDHINGDTTCNLIENLRVVTQKENARNQKKYKTNTSGTTGVSFTTKNESYEYWVAQWRNLNGKVKSKAFSVKTFGYDEAKVLAINYRNAMIEMLIKSGANYSDRHGK